MNTEATNSIQMEANTSDVSVWGFAKHIKASAAVDVDVTPSEARIKYEIVPDIRRYGIHGIDIDILEVSVTLNWMAYLDELSEDEIIPLKNAGGIVYPSSPDRIEGQVEINEKKGCAESKWSLNSKLAFTERGSLYVSGLEINFTDGSIDVI